MKENNTEPNGKLFGFVGQRETLSTEKEKIISERSKSVLNGVIHP